MTFSSQIRGQNLRNKASNNPALNSICGLSVYNLIELQKPNLFLLVHSNKICCDSTQSSNNLTNFSINLSIPSLSIPTLIETSTKTPFSLISLPQL